MRGRGGGEGPCLFIFKELGYFGKKKGNKEIN